MEFSVHRLGAPTRRGLCASLMELTSFYLMDM